ncbi:MAG TPA: WD40 repeat domain-containing protein [Candidatus Acidoferrum sp.]|nr:WD40 repeat domain-containing protein [Candidatus Acidoferrum sp.]
MKAAVAGVQSSPSQPIPQAQTPAAVPFAGLAPAPGEVAIPADAHRLDDLLQSGHSSSISALVFSRDGKWLASGGFDGSIILWNASTGEQIRKWATQNPNVTQLVFSPDSKRLLSADEGGIVRGWRIEFAEPTYTLNFHKFTRALAYSLDGQTWAVAVEPADEAANSQIELHDAESGKLIRTLNTEWQGVTAMTFTAQGALIASGGALDSDDAPDLSTAVWSVNTRKVEKTIPGGGVAFSPDGSLVADFEESNPAKILIKKALTGETKLVISAQTAGLIRFSADSRELVFSNAGNKELRICSMETGKEIVALPRETAIGSGGLQAVAFSADGKTLAAAPYEGNVIKTWDSGSGRELHTFPGQLAVQGIAVSADGRWLVAGSQHGTSIWDLETRKLTTRLDGAANFAVFSIDGRWLATNPGAQFPGETLKVWDTKTWTLAADFHFAQRGTPVFSIAFIPNDSPLTPLGPLSRSFEFKADDEKHTVWSSPTPVSVSPDQKILAVRSGMGGDVDLWDLASGQKLRTIAAHKLSVIALSFSRDGRWLLTGGQETPARFPSIGGQMPPIETRIRVWDTTTWTEHYSLAFNRIGSGAASFSPDSRILIVEKDWDLVELFDIASSTPLATFTAADLLSHARQFSTGNLLITPDGSLLMQAAQNGVRIWHVPAQENTAASKK